MLSCEGNPPLEGIMGGTFDPIHLGHLLIARAALEELGLSRVVFLPDGDPPHKKPLTEKDERLQMVRLACKGAALFGQRHGAEAAGPHLHRGHPDGFETAAAGGRLLPGGADTFLLFPPGARRRRWRACAAWRSSCAGQQPVGSEGRAASLPGRLWSGKHPAEKAGAAAVFQHGAGSRRQGRPAGGAGAPGGGRLYPRPRPVPPREGCGQSLTPGICIQ